MRFVLALRGWELASVISFVYTAIVAALLPRGLPSSARIRAVGGSVAGLLLTVASAMAPFHPLLHGWLLPPGLLLLGYWTSGLLFVAPMKQIEKLFAVVDRLVDVRRVGALAAALLVSNLRPIVFIWMLFNAAAVSAGAVFGRYHYAVDAIAGWVVAIAVWLLLMH
jgi:hypothetical protein